MKSVNNAQAFTRKVTNYAENIRKFQNENKANITEEENQRLEAILANLDNMTHITKVLNDEQFAELNKNNGYDIRYEQLKRDYNIIKRTIMANPGREINNTIDPAKPVVHEVTGHKKTKGKKLGKAATIIIAAIGIAATSYVLGWGFGLKEADDFLKENREKLDTLEEFMNSQTTMETIVTPTAIITPGPTPEVTPVITPTVEPTPAPTAVVTPTVVPTPEPTPIVTPTVVPTPVPTAVATPTVEPASKSILIPVASASEVIMPVVDDVVGLNINVNNPDEVEKNVALIQSALLEKNVILSDDEVRNAILFANSTSLNNNDLFASNNEALKSIVDSGIIMNTLGYNSLVNKTNKAGLYIPANEFNNILANVTQTNLTADLFMEAYNKDVNGFDIYNLLNLIKEGLGMNNETAFYYGKIANEILVDSVHNFTILEDAPNETIYAVLSFYQANRDRIVELTHNEGLGPIYGNGVDEYHRVQIDGSYGNICAEVIDDFAKVWNNGYDYIANQGNIFYSTLLNEYINHDLNKTRK